MKRRELLSAGGALLLAPLAGAAHAAADKPTALEDALRAVVEDERYPLAGLSTLVMRSGRIVQEAQFGQRHYAPELPITRDTLFRVASISKFVVGLGAMRLVEQGKLDLDADIGDVLGVRLRNPAFPKDQISVSMLLSHTSSLRDDAGIAFPADVSLIDKLNAEGSKSWSADHGPRWFAYCNLNYGLLATLMEKVTGQRFDQLMRELVLTPLGMLGGFNALTLSEMERSNVATLYRKQRVEPAKEGSDSKEDREIWDATAPWRAQTDDWTVSPPKPIANIDAYVPGRNGTLFGPQGGLRTRVSDLGAVMAMLMNGGMHQGKRFLKKSSIDRMFSEVWRHEMSKGNGDNFAGEFLAWGTGAQHFIDKTGPGWGDRLLEKGGVQAWGHLGFAWGLQAGFMIDASRTRGIIYVSSGHAADPQSHRGRFSSFPQWEEKVHDLLWTTAVAQP
ncbi:serine hydrolase domain-containing protein [Burkholderiaceae bacterium UC74_6]